MIKDSSRTSSACHRGCKHFLPIQDQGIPSRQVLLLVGLWPVLAASFQPVGYSLFKNHPFSPFDNFENRGLPQIFFTKGIPSLCLLLKKTANVTKGIIDRNQQVSVYGRLCIFWLRSVSGGDSDQEHHACKMNSVCLRTDS